MEFSPDVSKPYIGVSYSAPQFSGRGFYQNGRKVHLPKLAALTCHFGQAGEGTPSLPTVENEKLVYIEIRRKLIVQKYLASLDNRICALCVFAYSTIQDNPIIQSYIWVACLYILCVGQFCCVIDLIIQSLTAIIQFS